MQFIHFSQSTQAVLQDGYATSTHHAFDLKSTTAPTLQIGGKEMDLAFSILLRDETKASRLADSSCILDVAELMPGASFCIP
ncbi:hypothetical protein M378DRAFT_155816 [Amanita muscaria Koide BX008]|uniref:Uncharacterized protein n=1 Tax=Amanita muscaria (strain Koide BX008) TaxID=946122 RepID=A0A0C2XNW8_AMAMK|nr:hypothetical protein M378DRAFT_155816 [Amanita muscaria Koide BX008]